jgi:hypothetical protein
MAAPFQLNSLQSQSQSYITTGSLPPISSCWQQAIETHEKYFFQLKTRCYSPYITSSLMSGWVCGLQLLLVLASAVILGSESRGTHDHIFLSHIRDSSNLEGQVPVFIYLRNRVT